MRATAVRCYIRPMQPSDIAMVLDIERQSFPSMWPRTVYQRELKNKLARYLVACEPAEGGAPSEEPSNDAPSGGVGALLRRLMGASPPSRERVLGMVGLWCMMGEGHIVTLAVHDQHRRQGIGELLLVVALEAALEASQDLVTLEYRISSQAARALYEKYGFSQVGVRARYYSDNQEDAVLMSTPPLRSSIYRRLLSRRIADQRKRWGDGYPLAERAGRLVQTTSLAP
jgi:ribosomal-protein-alanine N-acetyltransferase